MAAEGRQPRIHREEDAGADVQIDHPLHMVDRPFELPDTAVHHRVRKAGGR
jgi:hypothetical protein